jgi:hypothetical protein
LHGGLLGNCVPASPEAPAFTTLPPVSMQSCRKISNPTIFQYQWISDISKDIKKHTLRLMVNFQPKPDNLTMDKNSFEFREQRTATRYPVVLFVEFEVGTGWTLDISTSDALIETSEPFLSGAVIAFSVLQSNQHDCATRLYCKGVVVRVEQDGEIGRIAIYMQAMRFEA